jgi:HEAT repeat protein
MVNQYSELTNQIRELVENQPDEGILNYLISYLKHPSTVVRLQAVEALGYTRNSGAIEALVDTMRHDADLAVQAAAAQSLGIIGHVSATPALAEMLRGDISHPSEVKVRWAAAQALSFIGDPNAVDVLVEAFTKDYGRFEEQASEIREAARDALVSIGEESVVDKLIALWCKPILHPIEDIDLFIRNEMITAFSQIESPKALDFLLTLAHHDHPVVRESVMSALTYPQDPRIVPILTEALNDGDSYVRDAAEFSLQRLGKHL